MAKIQLIKPCSFRFWTFIGSALFWLLASYPIRAQIVPDTTLPNNSIVTPSGNTSIITGGTQAGRNLFHSFKEFSVLPNREAFFNNNNAGNIQNIISRVTGGFISKIDGSIRANGVNLFFINPSGIIFGPNASLNVGGSFVASTANSLRFADGTEFSATNAQATPLLTISVPSGLQFRSNLGRIENQSQASLDGAVNSNDPPARAGLQVPDGKTLALVGGEVSIEEGNLTAKGGRIELGSVGTGVVNLTEIPQGGGYALGYSGVQNFQDINLSNGAQANGAQVDASGARGGDIHLQGRNITLAGGAEIFSATKGANTGGNLTIDAAESIKLSGDNTLLSTQTLGTGSAGNLRITTRNLTVESGANIFSTTQEASTGTGGNLTVDAAESIKLSGNNTLLSTSTSGAGSAGNLTITTRNLTVESGASIQTPSFGQGQAGNLLVKATDTVTLSGTTTDGMPSGLSAEVAPNATSKGGNLTIETGQLTIRNGAAVDASTFGAAQAGNVQVIAKNIELEGFAKIPNKLISSGIFAQVADDSKIPNAGNAGSLTIETGRLTVLNGAQIAVTARKNGNGGDLTINASDSIQLSGALPNATPDRGSSGIVVAAESLNAPNSPVPTGNVGNLTIYSRNGQITVEKGAKISAKNEGTGQGGTLTLNVRQLRVQDGGLVQSGSFASGPGGTLTVNATESVNVIGKGNINSFPVDSTLSAEATASGKAGDLNITTRSLNIQDGAKVTVSSPKGQAGNLTVTAKDIRLNQGSLTAETAITGDEEGANINLQGLDFLLLQNQSLISARAASNNAKGGNINIDAAKGVVAAVPDQHSDINANASAGEGGNITINAQGIFGLTNGHRDIPDDRTNYIDASSQYNKGGTVTINTPDVDPSRGLIELPVNVVDPTTLIAQNPCQKGAGSAFIVTGRGGLPRNPNEALSSNNVQVDLVEPVSTSTHSPSASIKPLPTKPTVKRIVPAQGWVFNDKGKVVLTAYDPLGTGHQRTSKVPAACPAF